MPTVTKELPYTLTLITSNDTKYRETCDQLGKVERLKLDLPEIQSLDAKEVIEAKLQAAKGMIPDADKRILMVDDEGLVFEGLGGLPGPLLKFFYKGFSSVPGETVSSGLYKLANAFGTKKAWATLAVGLAIPGRTDVFFESQIEGTVVPPRGLYSAGYGDVFQINSTGKTYSEMAPADRDKIWLRALALAKVREYLNSF